VRFLFLFLFLFFKSRPDHDAPDLGPPDPWCGERDCYPPWLRLLPRKKAAPRNARCLSVSDSRMDGSHVSDRFIKIFFWADY
jgi:hypothetical protein